MRIHWRFVSHALFICTVFGVFFLLRSHKLRKGVKEEYEEDVTIEPFTNGVPLDVQDDMDLVRERQRE